MFQKLNIKISYFGIRLFLWYFYNVHIFFAKERLIMNLDLIRGLQVTIIAFLSYTITITFTGWFESWIAKQVGDDTPEQFGFLSLNPLDHFNVFGFAAVLWNIFYGHLLPFGIIPAWGRYIPLLPGTMHGNNLKLRAFIELTARSVGHFILLIAVRIPIFFMFALHITLSPYVESIFYLLAFMFNQNLLLFAFYFILGLFKYIIHFYVPRLNELSIEKIIIVCLILSLSLYVLRPLLENFVYIVIELMQVIFFKMGLV